MAHQEDLNQALKQAINLLQRRPHSPKELYEKLSRKHPSALCLEVIQIAKKKKWLPSQTTLAEQVTLSLHDKNKSWQYIEKYLEKKGLPIPSYSKDKEVEKIQKLISKKFQSASSYTFEIKNKMRQYLMYRGFEEELIESVLSDL